MKNRSCTNQTRRTAVPAILFLLAVSLTQLTGCATNTKLQPPDYAAAQNDPGGGRFNKVALVTNPTPPEIEGVTLGVTYGEGAAKGAGAGALGGAGFIAEGFSGCNEAACALVFLGLLPVFMLGGAVVGGVAGGLAGESADTLAASESQAQQMLSGGGLQIELLVRAEEYGQSHLDIELVRGPVKSAEEFSAEENRSALANESIDHVLSLELLQVSLDRSLEMRGRAQLISVQTGAVLSDEEYSYVSESRSREDWMADNAQRLVAAINRGLQTIAEGAIDEQFMLYYTEEPEGETTARAIEGDDKRQLPIKYYVPHYVLAPVVPDLEVDQLFSDDTASWHLKFVVVDALKPTFQWEPFPREFEAAAQSNEGHRITNVRYELRVYDAVEPFNPNHLFVPGLKVYEAIDIPEPTHTIDVRLRDCSEYYWTVRAKFDLDGQTRATEWAGVYGAKGQFSPWYLRSEDAGQRPALSPEQFYYPFKVACY
ncbi:MAG: hypothetical protein PVH25_10435 [Burkholderiales bacterium]